MPLLKQYELSGIRVLAWKVTETVEELQGMVSHSIAARACEDFTSEKRRAEWLAVRALLSNCLDVDARVVYDAAGKPSLEGFDGEISICQRSLRASTPKGDRVSLSASEEVPAGATMTFWVLCLNDAHVPAVKEWFDYGILRGTGQWRNSGKGRFMYEILDEAEPTSFSEAVKLAQ